MCRYDPITKTERRCPSYLDKASYNAKRRARYQAKKNGNSFSSAETPNTDLQTLMQSKRFTLDANSHLSKQKIVNNDLIPLSEEDSTVSFHVSDDYEEIESLNVKVYDASGSFVEAQYFNDKMFAGQIDHTQIDEESYKTFFPSMEGTFTEIYDKESDSTWSHFKRPEVELFNSMSTIKSLSKSEIDNLSEEEKFSLEFFSSSNFSWFNDAIYSNGATLDAKYTNPTDIMEDRRLWGVTQSSSNAKKIVQHLDAALEKGPKIQRTLYRGASSEISNMFQGLDSSDWVDQIKLGQEMKFDGYQSATQSFEVAHSYTAGGGVLFEILTPEGIQISDCSKFAEEKETLLPRDSRYVVVGIHKDQSTVLDLNVVQLVAVNSKGEILDGTNSDKPKPLDFSKAQN